MASLSCAPCILLLGSKCMRFGQRGLPYAHALWAWLRAYGDRRIGAFHAPGTPLGIRSNAFRSIASHEGTKNKISASHL